MGTRRDNQLPPTLTVPEAAARLSVNRWRVLYRIEDGTLPAREHGGKFVLLVSDVDANADAIRENRRVSSPLLDGERRAS